MPNDTGGQFPSPPKPVTAAPSVGEAPPTIVGGEGVPATEVKLTDEIAPILTAQPPELAPRSPAMRDEDPAVVPPNGTKGDKPAETAGKPATLPATIPTSVRQPFPIVTILLLLISVAAIAATYFFFQQNQTLNRQLIEINQTLQQQIIKDSQITTTPTAAPEIIITPEATTSATPSATPTVTNLPGKAFDQMDAVMTLATGKYPNAQLLMITATAAESAPTTIIKYWFRQDQTTKRYLYVLKELGKEPSLVDQQVYVTPDNNIPSLNQAATSGALGIDLDEAISLTTATCPTTISCIANPITGLFVTKDNITRWQITYKPPDGSKPYVVQIDSATKAILFKSQ